MGGSATSGVSGYERPFTFNGLPVIESVYMVEDRTHPMSTERTLGRIVGGSWSLKTFEAPAARMVAGKLYAHPQIVASLRQLPESRR